MLSQLKDLHCHGIFLPQDTAVEFNDEWASGTGKICGCQVSTWLLDGPDIRYVIRPSRINYKCREGQPKFEFRGSGLHTRLSGPMAIEYDSYCVSGEHISMFVLPDTEFGRTIHFELLKGLGDDDGNS